MSKVTLNEAGRLAALQEMRRDPTVWVLGEDVARGGLWGQYKGFLDEFGPTRVVSTPISESTIMGAGLGAALVGTRPIIEMRIFDFVMCAMDELVNQVAKVRYMFGGQAKPSVVTSGCRTACGATPRPNTVRCWKRGSRICRA
jgi:pyruvate/2-oxoglutarate/acetoin dehydrogenase E1 component